MIAAERPGDDPGSSSQDDGTGNSSKNTSGLDHDSSTGVVNINGSRLSSAVRVGSSSAGGSGSSIRLCNLHSLLRQSTTSVIASQGLTTIRVPNTRKQNGTRAGNDHRRGWGAHGVAFQEPGCHRLGALVQRASGDAPRRSTASSAVDTFANLETVRDVPDDLLVCVSVSWLGSDGDGAGERSAAVNVCLGRDGESVEKGSEGDGSRHFEVFYFGNEWGLSFDSSSDGAAIRK
ncbi:hypothetical protein HG531_007190 [Fusarium graminearum]|nr:hypothetical protein HG531_007190 [Fusarium graminearum]